MIQSRTSQSRNARPRSATIILLITLLLLLLSISGDVVAASSKYFFLPNARSFGSKGVEVTLRAPHTTISWDERDAARENYQLPLLYLRHQREAAPTTERTLDISVSGLAGGTEIQVEVESFHTNVATGKRYTLSKRFATPDRSSTANNPHTIQWTFDAALMPSDFYSLRIRDQVGEILVGSADRPAFVALDTWDVALNPYTVRIYFATLFPFSRGPDDVENTLSPAEVTKFVADQFAPIIQDTWHTQVTEWGFGAPLHPRWDADKVVDIIITAPPFALMDGTGTYAAYIDPSGRPFHERRVWWRSNFSGLKKYDTLENGYKSVFAHEFFHLMQWNILLISEQPANLWMNVFIEAQAEFAVSVQYPELELHKGHITTQHSAYLSSANLFLAHRLNSSYRDLQADQTDKYDATLYWRFLYEQYNDMGIVRAALEEMVAYYDADIVSAMGTVMDAAFARLDGPFHTFEESLIAFARANYALRLENGRCMDADLASCEGFYYDPEEMYVAPSLEAQLYYYDLGQRENNVSPSVLGLDHSDQYHLSGIEAAVNEAKPATYPTYSGAIATSYGMDFIEVRLDPAVRGKPLAFTFQAEGTTGRFSVQIWRLSAGAIRPRAMTLQPETVPSSTISLASTTSAGDRPTSTVDRLAVIVTRLDPNETADPVGAYQFTLKSYAEANEASANE